VTGFVRRALLSTLVLLAVHAPAALGAETVPPPLTTDAPRAAPEPVAAPAAPAAAFPIDGKWRMGRGMSSGHQGVDVFAACGTPLVAPKGGRVVRVATHGSAGHYVIVRAPSGDEHVFMHLRREASVKPGADLEPGDALGAVGDSGNADGCHLHFEVWSAPGWYAGGAPRDPRPALERWAAS